MQFCAYRITFAFIAAVLPIVAQPAPGDLPAGIVGMRYSQLYDDTVPNKRGALVIMSVTPGLPAANAGLAAGDIIAAINGKKVAGRKVDPEEVRGEIGSEVKLIVGRNGKGFEIPLQRVSPTDQPQVTSEQQEQQQQQQQQEQEQQQAQSITAAALQNALAAALGQPAAAAQPQSAASRLAGSWHKVETDNYNTKETWLDLSPDGTYKKVFKARLFSFGAVAYDESGQWTANGSLIFLSGDSQRPASTENLAAYSRGR
jgi:membrane-associated protease RseP (regulator of RpoE activity)